MQTSFDWVLINFGTQGWKKNGRFHLSFQTIFTFLMAMEKMMALEKILETVYLQELL